MNTAAPIIFAPTGGVFTKDQTQHLPITPAEIAADVARAVEIGITAVHLHARDESGAPAWKKEYFADIIFRIRETNPDLVINVSTSGRTWPELAQRADVLSLSGDLKPDVASLTLSSLNFIEGTSLNSPQMIRDLARIMLDNGVVPELEIFDLGMINFAKRLHHEGLLPDKVPANLFFGNIASMQPTLLEMGAAISLLPDFVIWSAAGIGRFQNTAQAQAISAGGGVRVGLEDGIYFDHSGQTLATNTALLERVHGYLSLAERRFMTPSEFRNEI